MNDIIAIAQAEKEQALRKLFVKEMAESLEIAEINVLLNSPIDGKNEAARELQRRAALSNNAQYSKCKADKSAADRLLIEADYALTIAQKTWQAQQAQNELKIAQLNENASHMTLEAARLGLEAAKLIHSQEESK